MKSNPPPDDGLYGVIKELFRGPVHAILSQIHGEPAGAKPVLVDVLEYVQLLEFAATKKADDQEIIATIVRREETAEARRFTRCRSRPPIQTSSRLATGFASLIH